MPKKKIVPMQDIPVEPIFQDSGHNETVNVEPPIKAPEPVQRSTANNDSTFVGTMYDSTPAISPALFGRQIVQQEWVKLPADVRRAFVEQFKIPRSSGSEVHNSVLFSDGHTNADLAVVNIDSLQQFTGSDSTDLHALVIEAMHKLIKI